MLWNVYLLEWFKPASAGVGGAAITQHFKDREAMHTPSEEITLNLLAVGIGPLGAAGPAAGLAVWTLPNFAALQVTPTLMTTTMITITTIMITITPTLMTTIMTTIALTLMTTITTITITIMIREWLPRTTPALMWPRCVFLSSSVSVFIATLWFAFDCVGHFFGQFRARFGY